MASMRFPLLLSAIAMAAPAVAGADDYRNAVVGRWMQSLSSGSGAGPRVQPADIDEALKLADRTLDFVASARPLPELAPRLKALRAEWDAGRSLAPEQREGFYQRVRWLRREILFSHPALSFDRILFNRNPPTTYSHNGDQHLGVHSRPGPGLTILTDWKTHPRATAILQGKLPAGAVRNPDLDYGADRIVFAFCDHTAKAPLRERFFLYEAAVDGSWVRQLTGTSRDPFATWNGRATAVIEDNDPCYLPDGGIVFISTRGQSFGRCHGGRYNPAWVLHRCDANGDNIRQLSFGNENEYEPAVLDDGRLVFTRWEYTNRHEMLFHKLWACRPDGTYVSHYYGNDTLHPMEVVEATAIPGTGKVVATAQGHHSYNTGTAVVIDVRLGENGEAPLTHLTPETPYSESNGWPKPHFSHPYPITSDLFLISRANHPVPPQGQTPPPNDRAIYLIDTLGGREFIYEDPSVASFSPIPVRPRVRPPVMAPATPPDPSDDGIVYVQNVYRTRNDPEHKIKPGSIRALRVNALGVQPRADRSACSMTVPVEIPKKVLGTAPVDANGSACFRVPAETALQIQILDENGMAVLTEKSFFYLQKGERRGCVGCHEPEGSSPYVQPLQRQPVRLTPPAGPQYPGGLSFMRTVQPVLDRYCISCHGLDKTDAGVNLVDDGNYTWPRPYVELTRRGDHRLGEKEYMWTAEKNISRPYQFYAFGNRVSELLLKDHGHVNIDRDSRQRVIDWMDLNAQCYGDLFPNKVEQRRLDAEAVKELRAFARQLLGETFAGQPERALVNVAQPAESRVLMAPLASQAGGWGQRAAWKSKDDPGYRKMAQLVARCILPVPNENDNGWQPNRRQGGGQDWVIEDQLEYLKRLRPSAVSSVLAP
ncbi:MAG: hypothetical protein NTV86_15385 [Planctomycetota bacterium]|nr:hypothetical protein [Planctomycetota bacterium]